MPSDDLKEKENDTGSGFYESSSELDVDDLEKSFAAPSAKDKDLPKNHPSKKKKFSLNSLVTPKRIVIGSVITFLVTGILFFMNLIAGPLELLHLQNVLNITSRPTESIMRTRTGSLLRNARAAQSQDIGRSRVGRLGNRIFMNVNNQLADIGVGYTERSARTGTPRNMTIDPSQHPRFSTTPGNQMKTDIARHYGVSPDRVSGSGNSWNVNLERNSIAANRALIDTNLRSLENGKITTNINKRVMAKFFNVPSLFRPFQRLQAAAEQNLDTRTQRRQAEKERKANKRPRLPERYQNAIDRARNRLQGWSGRIAGAVVLQGIYCNIYYVRRLLPLVNYANVVAPAALASVDSRSVGAQLQAGENINLAQANQVVEQFTYDADEAIEEIGRNNLDEDDIEQMEANDGKNIWSGQALNALTYNNSGSGQAIDPGYKFAFAGELQGETLSFLFEDSNIGEVACSDASIIVGGVLGTVLIAVPGPGWKVKLASAGGQALLFMAAINALNNLIIDRASEHAVEMFSGPQGGNLLAYGARASNNMNAKSMGGVELSDEQVAVLKEAADHREQLEMREKSFAQRTFDIRDYRSTTARAYRTLSTTFDGGIINGILSSMNPVALFSSISHSLTSSVNADTSENYDWGFPVYGVPLETLEENRYEDPYYNASEIVDILDDPNRQALADELKNRANTCFGVGVVKRSGEWTVQRNEVVNPLEEEYKEANCNDTSSETWQRMQLFVLDNSILTAIDCYEGGATSCQDLGIGTGEAVTTTGSGQIIGDPNSPSDTIPCAPGTKDLGTDTPAWNNGERIPARLCEIEEWTDYGGSSGTVPGAGNGVVINSRVSGAWLALYNAAQADGVSLRVTSSFRTFERQRELCGPLGRHGCAPPGYSNHQSGHAIDFLSIFRHVNGRVGSSGSCQTAHGNTDWEWLVNNAERFGFGQLPIEAWHWDADYQGGCE